MKRALSLDELRTLLSPQAGREYLSCPFLSSGIPRGAISEVSGSGKTQFAANLLLAHPELKVAWIEEHFSINPFGLQQNKIQPHKVVFVEAGREIEWAAVQALRSKIFQVLVLYGEFKDIKSLRRIQLASEKANAATLWLTPKPQHFWTSSLRLVVKKDPVSKKLHVTSSGFKSL
jgi:hypothetical protein